MHTKFQQGRESCFRQPSTVLLPRKFHDRLGLAVDVQFLVDALDVGAHRAQADAQFAGNLLVGVAA